jgi:hypothetical protein
MDKSKESTPLHRFESLAKKLFAVPKAEMDKVAEQSSLHKPKKPKITPPSTQ